MLDSFERYTLDSSWLARALENLPGSFAGPVRPLEPPFGVVGFGEGAWPAEFARSWIDAAIVTNGTQFVLAGGLDFGEVEAAALIGEASGSRVFRIGQGERHDPDAPEGAGVNHVVAAGPLSAYAYLQALAYATNHSSSAEAADAVLRELCERCRTDVPTADNPAKSLAWSLWTRTPLLLATQDHALQVWAWHLHLSRLGKSMSIPLERNALMVVSSGFEARHETGDSLVALLLGGEDESLRLVHEILESRLDEVIPVEALSGEAYAAGLGLWYLGAWVAFYLAMLYGVDPKDADSLERLRGL